MSSRSSTDPSQLAIGRVRSAFGVRGELKVEPFSRETAHFERLDAVTVLDAGNSTVMRIEGVRTLGDTLLVKFAGVDTPEDAKRFSGCEIYAPRDSAAPCGPDEFYYADLVGLRVRCDGVDAGVVETIWEQGGAAYLGVRIPDGGERLVPFQHHFVGTVDLDQGFVDVLSAEVLA
ncbi:MAG: 16S rRNA processing protein RimM [Spirochaetaceae bacterium]|nr:MAG: 16S rRNA processing protein RimM [Spirochaetaceae bacterium]